MVRLVTTLLIIYIMFSAFYTAADIKQATNPNDIVFDAVQAVVLVLAAILLELGFISGQITLNNEETRRRLANSEGRSSAEIHNSGN